MKKTIRIISLVLCLLMMVSFVATASADTVTSKKFTVAKYGANKTTFYVHAENTKEVKIGYTCTKGYLAINGKEPVWGAQVKNNCYGYYEFQIWGKSGNTWVPIHATAKGTQKNIKNSESNSKFLTVKGYTEYKVAVYAWNTKNFNKTINSSYGTNSYYLEEDILKLKYPSISFKFSNCKSISN